MLNKEITDAIRTNLPAMVGDELQRHLEQATRDNRDLEIANKEIVSLNKNIDDYKSKIAALKDELQKHEALNSREKSINEKENNLKVTLAENRASSAEYSKTEIFTLVDKIFRNNYVKREVATSIGIGSMYQNNGNNIPYETSRTTSEITTEE